MSATSYAPHGGLTQWTTGDSVARTTGYDARLRAHSIMAGGTLGLGLDWNANGTLHTETITRLGSSFTQTFTYDGVNRLKTAAETNSAAQTVWAQTYVFDKAGNRALLASSQEISGGASTYTPHSSDGVNVPYDGKNRWTGVDTPAGYDVAGNMTALRTQAMGYDAESRMVSWADSSTGGSASFAYDGDGRRVSKTVGSVTTWYVYDPVGRLAVEAGGVAPAVSSTSYLTRDHLGSVRLVTQASGACVGVHDYLPFGEEIPAGWGRAGIGCYGVTADTDQKFTGQRKDEETGLNDFVARQMAGPQGRFLSVDRDQAGRMWRIRRAGMGILMG